MVWRHAKAPALAVLFLSSLLAAPVGLMTNCTGGEADLGILPVLLAPALASTVLLTALRPSRKVGYLTLFAAAPFALVAVTLIDVARGWFGRGMTACQTLLGLPYPADGNESLTPLMLAAIGAIFLLSVVCLVRGQK